ncbi:MAG: hypothetical protein G01um101466_702 [Parcubacteria group bacterium Gr01-1014_66]|nr:MAG: hypothetical protein G01um101466_702 [Parcubacteria group bacterium Gr01-1014_66]
MSSRPELIAYIKSELARGVNRDMLAKILSETGWDPDEIETGLQLAYKNLETRGLTLQDTGRSDDADKKDLASEKTSFDATREAQNNFSVPLSRKNGYVETEKKEFPDTKEYKEVLHKETALSAPSPGSSEEKSDSQLSLRHVLNAPILHESIVLEPFHLVPAQSSTWRRWILSSLVLVSAVAASVGILIYAYLLDEGGEETVLGSLINLVTRSIDIIF